MPREPLAVPILAVALAIGAIAAMTGAWSLAVLVPIVAVVYVLWPAAAAATLVVACALDRLAIGVGGSNVRLDELAALALAGVLLVRALFARDSLGLKSNGRDQGLKSRATARHSSLTTHRSGWGVRAIPLLAPLLAYLFVNVLATIASGSNLTRGIDLDLITLDLIVLYVAVVVYANTPERLSRMVYWWLAVAGAEAVIGIAAFVLSGLGHGAAPGVQLNDTGAPMVYGTMYEANIFGSYMSAAFLIALALAAEETVRRKAPLYLVCVLTAIGLLLSATRSAWGSTVLCVVLLLALLRLGRGRRGRGALRVVGATIGAVVVVGVGLLAAPASVSGPFVSRFLGLLNFATGSGYGRLQLYDEALSEWRAHPLLGLGPGSFTYRLPGDTSTGPAWLPNLTLQVLHDTGIIGLAVLVWLFVAFYASALGALRRAAPGAQRAMLAGLIASVTALLIAFQLTPGFTLGYSWAILALAAASAAMVGVGERAPAAVPGAAAA
jgi:O-antigen ligase